MRTTIAIITRNRVAALTALLAGLQHHCPSAEVIVVDDCSDRDSTQGVARGEKTARADLEGWRRGLHLSGWTRLGVAGNTNRAIRLLMESESDHFMLLNDDVSIAGPADSVYREAHAKLGVGLLCGADESDEGAAWSVDQARRVKLLRRLPGAVLSFTRPVVERVGYFDTRFGRFGQEHVDFTHRCRAAGFVSLDGVPRYGIDVLDSGTGRQNCQSSVEFERAALVKESDEAMELALRDYQFTDPYRPFSLSRPRLASGISVWNLGFLEVTQPVGQPPVNT